MIQLIILWCLVMSVVRTSSTEIPSVDSLPMECKLPDGTNGSCQPIEQCASSVTAKNISICHMDGWNLYVCCKKNLWNDLKYYRLTDGCGMPPRVGISQGFQTKYGEFPYMVALGWESLFSDDSYDYKCGGILISPKYVLTAAHCTKLHRLEPSVVLVGGKNLTDSTAKPIKIAKVFTHPDYLKNESYHDIALLELETRVWENPICVWGLYELDDLNVTVIGYGHTQFAGVGSDSLLKTYLTIVPNQECALSYTNEEATLPNGIVETQICAKDFVRGSDTCQGDSGGPLILFTKSKYGFYTPFLVGITSFGKACTLDSPGVYTRVSEYIDWIESVMYNDK